MNKKLRNKLVAVLAVFFAILAIIQFTPFFIDGNQFKNIVYQGFEENTDLKLNIKNIKLSGAPFLKTKVTLEDPFIQTKKGEPVFYSPKTSVSVDMLPLILKQVKISDINIIAPDIYVVKEKSKKFNFERTSPLPQKQPQKSDFKINTNGLNIFIKDYQVSFWDKSTQKPLETKIKGQKLKISNLNSVFGTKIATDGAIAINNTRCLNYDIKTDIDIPAFLKYQEENPLTSTEESSPFNPLYEISRYGIKADLLADLKIKNPEDIHGKMIVNKLSLKLNGERIPDSQVNIMAKKNKFITDANIYFAPKEIINLEGEFGKNLVDLKLKTSNIQLSKVQAFANALMETFGTSSKDLEKIKLKGNFLADLKLKSNMKNIKSSGFFKINNAEINYDKGLFTINSFKSNIKLDDNNIQILDTEGLIDGNKFLIKGSIDKKALADIKIHIPSTNINSLTQNKFAKSSTSAISKLNGSVSADVHLTGKLNKLKYQGDVLLSQISLYLKDSPAMISFSTGKIISDVEKATLNIPQLNINNSPFSVNGKISFKNKKNPANIDIKGKLKALDLEKILKTKNLGQGEIPLICNIKAENNAAQIRLQLLNDAKNNLFITNSGSNSLLNVFAKVKNGTLDLSDVGLFKTPKTTLSENFEANIKGTTQIATATGAIKDFEKKQILDNIKINILSPLKILIPLGKNASTQVTGKTTLTGTVKKPEIRGNFIFTNTNLPEFKAKITKLNLNLKNHQIDADVINFYTGQTALNLQTSVNVKNPELIIIEKLNVNANRFDADEFFVILGKIAPPAPPKKIEYSLKKKNTPHQSPIVIKSGTFSAKTFIMTQIPFYDLKTNLILDRYNLLTIDNLSATVFGGYINGIITHDIANTITNLDIKARRIDADSFGVNFLKLPKRKLRGIGDSNIKLSFKGVTDREIISSLNGGVNFKVFNGEMGDLGKLDYYLRAANILSNNLLSLNINRILNGVKLKNTGEFEQAYGELTFSQGGIMKINTLKTVGPRLSLYISGYVNNLNSNGTLNVYGRISEEVVGILGPLGDFSIDKILKNIPLFDTLSNLNIGLLETNVSEKTRKEIPPLSIRGAHSQEFVARINGNINKPASVRSFKWLKDPQTNENTNSP